MIGSSSIWVKPMLLDVGDQLFGKFAIVKPAILSVGFVAP